MTAVLRLQLEERWRQSVLVSRGFEQGVWAGPASHHPFPLEGFDCPAEGFSLAAREGESFLVTPPLRDPVRLSEGMRCEWTQGELTLRAWVTREPQAVSVAWLWLPGGPVALLAFWQLAKFFGVFFALLLALLPSPRPPLRVAAAVEPVREVKVLPFTSEVKPSPLPETPSDRLQLLMDGKRSSELFADAARRDAEREKAKPPPKPAKLPEAQIAGVFAAMAANDTPVDLLTAADEGVEGGVVGGVVGGVSEPVPQLFNSAEDEARVLARSTGPQCFGDDPGEASMMVMIRRDGTATAIKLAGSEAMAQCLKKRIASWKLPATPNGGRVTLSFRGEH